MTGYAELQCASHFSFLRGASSAEELFATAAMLGIEALAISDRIGAQTALAKLGFNPGSPDWVVGVNTRTALRAWQKSRGLIADGYLSMEMVRRLNVEAGALPN